MTMGEYLYYRGVRCSNKIVYFATKIKNDLMIKLNKCITCTSKYDLVTLYMIFLSNAQALHVMGNQVETINYILGLFHEIWTRSFTETPGYEAIATLSSPWVKDFRYRKQLSSYVTSLSQNDPLQQSYLYNGSAIA